MNLIKLLLLSASLGLSAAGPVLVLSFDALSAQEFTERTMPRFWKLSQQGQRGEGLPPFPATTFNGHATLATGCWPEHHGIVANGFIDPVLGPVRNASYVESILREPLWVAATRSGVRTAVYHWPCASGPWEGVVPWRMQVFAPGVPDRAALAFSEAALKDGALLVMTYLSGTDEEGHRHGVESPDVLAKLTALDQEIAPWVEKMLKAHAGLRVLLLADHGMATMTQGVDIRPALGQPATVIAHGGSAYVYSSTPLAAGVQAKLKAMNLQAWRPEELPEAYHLAASPRIGNLVVLAPLGTWISAATTETGRAAEQAGRHGAHGYDPAPPQMHTWLVALGTGSRTALPAIPLWNIAPTVAHWLKITWARQPDGKVVPELN